jgi:hypothetical protein
MHNNTYLRRRMLAFLSHRKICMHTDAIAAFAQEYSRVSNPQGSNNSIISIE